MIYLYCKIKCIINYSRAKILTSISLLVKAWTNQTKEGNKQTKYIQNVQHFLSFTLHFIVISFHIIIVMRA